VSKVLADFDKVRTPGTISGILLPYQRRWVEDKSPVKVIEKSRRVGISWAEAADDALYAASEHGDDVWYIGYNKEMALEFVSDAANWAKHYNLAASEMEETVFEDDEDKNILAYVIRFASGHTLTALSSRPKNLRGKHGRAVIDEAAFHDDLPGLLKAALAFLIWGGDVRIISTHFGDANEFNTLVQDCRSGRKKYSLHRVTWDDAIADGLCRRVFEILGRKWSLKAQAVWSREIIESYGDDADEELFCIPSQGTGVFLTRALIETCLSRDLPVIRYGQNDEFTFRPEVERVSEVEAWCEDNLLPILEALDPGRRSYFGEDFARTGHLTVITPLQEQQSANFYAPFMLELRNIPFEQQRQILFFIADRLPRFTFGALDARGNGQYLAEVAAQRYGERRIEQVMLSEAWYRDNMPKYKAAFEDRSITLPYDADVIEDHRAFKMIKGVAKLPEPKTNSKEKELRHGDSGVSGGLGWYATRQEGGGPIEHQSTGEKRAHTELDGYMGA
jgi:phage FluMu gp28-like protein